MIFPTPVEIQYFSKSNNQIITESQLNHISMGFHGRLKYIVLMRGKTWTMFFLMFFEQYAFCLFHLPTAKHWNCKKKKTTMWAAVR